VKIAFIITHNNVVVLIGILKVQSFVLTEVSDCGLLIVVTSLLFFVFVFFVFVFFVFVFFVFVCACVCVSPHVCECVFGNSMGVGQ